MYNEEKKIKTFNCLSRLLPVSSGKYLCQTTTLHKILIIHIKNNYTSGTTRDHPEGEVQREFNLH